jgi:hypothetical protein
MCERAVLNNRPSLDLSPIVLEGRRACRGAWDRPGVFLNPNSCTGFEPEPSKEGSWMMAQNDLIVVGIDAAKPVDQALLCGGFIFLVLAALQRLCLIPRRHAAKRRVPRRWSG